MEVGDFFQTFVAFSKRFKFDLSKMYVDKLLAFFDHLPPFVDIFYLINIDKSQHCWTTYTYAP